MSSAGGLIHALIALEWMHLQQDRERENARRLATGLYEERLDGTGEEGVWLKKKAQRALCGAKTRAGGTCQAKAIPHKGRCRLHGGLSTGPRTEAGYAAIVASNLRRAQAKRKENE